MGNRRKTGRERRARRGLDSQAPAGHPFGHLSDAELSRTFRSSCNECGAPVKWVGAEEASAHGMDLVEAARQLGVPSVEGLDVWVCTRCDNGGVMGGAEWG